MKSVYEQIKKQNGQTFARALRDAGLLDLDDIVAVVKYAGANAEPILPYLWSLRKTELEEAPKPWGDPFEMLGAAGYDAELAGTFEKQNKIEKYFRKGEELCFFRDAEHHKKHHMITAVKKGADKIRREDFADPNRDDEYSRSVITINILKTGGLILISSRYNHSVESPDNNFNGNPDNIVPGLSGSLKKHFNVDFQISKVDLPRGYILAGGRIVRYDMERSGVFFGNGFYVKDGVVCEINKFEEVMVECKIINMRTRGVFDPSGGDPEFERILNEEISGGKMSVEYVAPGVKRLSMQSGGYIDITGSLAVSMHLPNAREIGDIYTCTSRKDFLGDNTGLRMISLPNVRTIGDGFLNRNRDLEYIYAPKLEAVLNDFLYSNEKMESISLPRLRSAWRGFLYGNTGLKKVDLPALEGLDDDFLHDNLHLTELSLPNLDNAGSNFLYNNVVLSKARLPKLKSVGYEFLYANDGLAELSLPNLRRIGGYCPSSGKDSFMTNNRRLKKISLPKLEEIYGDFLPNNKALKKIFLPRVMHIHADFMPNNRRLKKISLPGVRVMTCAFLQNHPALKEISIPDIRFFGGSFLVKNEAVELHMSKTVSNLNWTQPLSLQTADSILRWCRDAAGIRNGVKALLNREPVVAQR